jgi:hypothetical protein
LRLTEGVRLGASGYIRAQSGQFGSRTFSERPPTVRIGAGVVGCGGGEIASRSSLDGDVWDFRLDLTVDLESLGIKTRLWREEAEWVGV